MALDPNRTLQDPAVRDLIRRKARRLWRSVRAPAAGLEDLEQEITHQLLRRLGSYDAGRGTTEAFLAVIAGRVAANVLRHLHTNNRDGRRNAGPHEDADRDRRRPGPADGHADLAVDVRAVLAALPPDLHWLATGLMAGHTIAALARTAGRPRTTFYADIRRLRQRFEDAGLDAYLRP